MTQILLLLFLSFASVAHATTYTATDCTQSAVQTRVNSAVTGDTVVIPAGTCTWLTEVAIADTQTITLQGAGSGSTIIDGNVTAGYMLDMGKSGSRVTGIAFHAHTDYNIIAVYGNNWRIDHCAFTNSYGQKLAIQVYGSSSVKYPTGLIDNNSFTDVGVIVYGTATGHLDGTWDLALGLGTANAVYVEDNTFRRATIGSGNIMDCNSGGAYVFRHNTVYDASVEAHGVMQDARGTRKWEIYNNQFIIQNITSYHPAYLRGGTGVVFNNTFTGFTANEIHIDNVRSCYSVTTSPWYQCNGSSIVDGNASANGAPCRDQIGRGGDVSAWTDRNSPPAQTSQPAYAWNNTGNFVVVNDDCPNMANWIQTPRDYVNGTAMPGYNPYTYPHPLQGIGMSIVTGAGSMTIQTGSGGMSW